MLRRMADSGVHSRIIEGRMTGVTQQPCYETCDHGAQFPWELSPFRIELLPKGEFS
ncbi:MAG: hypothetical protein KJ630_13385 [Proteobacteria bacterium]|nr:hypothetical protein [Pseudomonadota bacterium]